MKIIAIVGTRDFDNFDFIEQSVLSRIEISEIEEVVSGGARGVDELAKQFAEKYNLKMTEFLPDWKQYGRSAGIIRNGDIVNRADIVFAFPHKASPGTRNTIKRAEKLNKEVYVFEIPVR